MSLPNSDGFVHGEDKDVHTWAMFRLVERHVVSPAGEAFERTFVSTPGAVAVVAITDAHEILFVSQYRATVHSLVREIPAGMRDIPGEDPAETARRELREETGYIAGNIFRLGQMLSSPGVTDSAVDIYVATDLVEGESEPHGPEEDSMVLELIPVAQAFAMVEDGRITDSKSVYGLLLTARMYPHLLG